MAVWIALQFQESRVERNVGAAKIWVFATLRWIDSTIQMWPSSGLAVNYYNSSDALSGWHSLTVKNVESSAKCNFLSQRTQCCAKQKIRHTQEHIYLRLLRSFVSWYARILAYSIPLLCVYFCVENRVEWHHSFRLESSGWWLNWLAKQFSKYTFVVLWHWLPTG